MFFSLFCAILFIHGGEIEHICDQYSRDPDNDNGGAYVSFGTQDLPSSKYFAKPDVYNLASNTTLHILSNFKTYQQSSDYSCGVACAIMAINYLNNAVVKNECKMYDDMGTSWRGTDPIKLADGIKAEGYDVTTNVLDTDRDDHFEEFSDFKDFVINAIDNGQVLIMLSNNWGGHYEIIIGYDKVGKTDEDGIDYEDDDVLIMADPYDTTDHHQDGYTIWSAWRFFALWHYTAWAYYATDEDAEAGVNGTFYTSTYIRVDGPTAAANATQNTAGSTKQHLGSQKEKRKTLSAVNPEILIEHKCNASDTVDVDYGGAYASEGLLDNTTSVYYARVDAYNLASSASLHILPHFKTYQQSSDYSCGVACAIMAMNYVSVNNSDVARECDLYVEMKTSARGSDPVVLAATIAAHGYNVTTNAGDPKRDEPFGEFAAFKDFVIGAIDKGEVLIVLSNNWGGHYEIIVGYDTMGTDFEDDDVLIMADPYDTTDHLQEGYTVWGAWRFYAIWHYTGWTYYNSSTDDTGVFYSSTYIKVIPPAKEEDAAGAPLRMGVKGLAMLVLALVMIIGNTVL